MTIILKGMNSAVFIAEMEFVDAKIAKSVSKLDLLPKVKVNWENGIGKTETIGKPKYKDYFECRKATHEYNKIRIDWVTNYLKNNYLDKDYADRYQERNARYYDSLRYPTEESKICEHHSDERHCTIKRESGCYTCCFVCWTPGALCQWAKCELLGCDENPIKE